MLNLDKNKKYLLACSFGPDSMALFDMLIKEKYDFAVVHVNYHLRDESNFEQTSLNNYCKKLGIPFYVKEVNQKIVSNIEAKCRCIRYSFFSNICSSERFDAVLVAHNEDDLIETYLLQKQRKNLVDYYGIAQKTIINNVIVLRPLLSFSKQELLDYCDTNKVPYSIDKTNLLPVYQRNKIRLNVLSKMNNKDRLKILNDIKIKNAELSSLKDKVRNIDNKVSNIKALNNTELAYYLNYLINGEKYLFPLTHNNIIEVRKLLESDKPNIQLFLNKNKYKIIKEYDSIRFSKNDSINGYEFLMVEPSLMDNEFFFADFTSDTSNRNISLCDYPLTIRTYKKGDKYQIKDYEVLVRRLFIDWKVPVSVRYRWPLIINCSGKIIYIPRYRKDFKPNSHCNFYVKECFTLK